MSPITPEQGSAAIAVLQFILALLTLPTILRREAQVPRWGSVPTALCLWLMAGVFLLMGPLVLAAAMSAVCAMGWTAIAVLRPAPSRKCAHGGPGHDTGRCGLGGYHPVEGVRP